MGSELELTLMIEDYHRTHPLHTGEVSVEGIKLKVSRPAARGEACMRPVYEEFDVAEMSLSWYVMARCRAEPIVALPIFPLRMFVQPHLFCSGSASIKGPEDLRGRKVGISQYRLTIGLWTRGILGEHYGVPSKDIQWLTSEPEGAGYQVPNGVKLTVQEKHPEQLLLEGEIDALIAPNVPASYRARDPRIRRVFPDCRAAVKEYFERTGIFPITHTMVIREPLARRHPWIAGKLCNAVREADRLCRRSYEYPKRLSFPTAVLIVEEEEATFGKEPWAHGLAANEHVLQKFVQYAEEQNYVPYQPKIDDLFLSEEGE